jgi:prolyl-tRNA synthetase
MTKAFIRVREIHFFEAHTCHRDFDHAERQIKEDIEIVERLFKKLCLPYLLHKRPEWDKFAGAFYSIGIDVLLPSKKVMQLGSIHQYKENFSKAFGITYEDERGEHRYCHQTTYGMSERILGAVIGIHGDDRGIVLPPVIAPIQIVIIPIIFKGKEKIVAKECSKVLEKLKDAGIRAIIDDRDMTPGNKFYYWEMRGVPLRIEIGPSEARKGIITLVRRDGKRMEVAKEKIIESINKEMDSFAEQLWKKAEEELDGNIWIDSNIKEKEKKEGILELPWCGKEECGLEMEEKFDMDSLGIPIERKKSKKSKIKKCPICGKKAEKRMRFAKTI